MINSAVVDKYSCSWMRRHQEDNMIGDGEEEHFVIVVIVVGNNKIGHHEYTWSRGDGDRVFVVLTID
jgi:hypothetical protein